MTTDRRDAPPPSRFLGGSSAPSPTPTRTPSLSSGEWDYLGALVAGGALDFEEAFAIVQSRGGERSRLQSEVSASASAGANTQTGRLRATIAANRDAERAQALALSPPQQPPAPAPSAPASAPLPPRAETGSLTQGAFNPSDSRYREGLPFQDRLASGAPSGGGGGAVGPAGRTVEQVRGTEYLSDEERTWYLQQTRSRPSGGGAAASSGGSSGSGRSRSVTSENGFGADELIERGGIEIAPGLIELTLPDGRTAQYRVGAGQRYNISSIQAAPPPPKPSGRSPLNLPSGVTETAYRPARSTGPSDRADPDKRGILKGQPYKLALEGKPFDITAPDEFLPSNFRGAGNWGPEGFQAFDLGLGTPEGQATTQVTGRDTFSNINSNTIGTEGYNPEGKIGFGGNAAVMLSGNMLSPQQDYNPAVNVGGALARYSEIQRLLGEGYSPDQARTILNMPRQEIPAYTGLYNPFGEFEGGYIRYGGRETDPATTFAGYGDSRQGTLEQDAAAERRRQLEDEENGVMRLARGGSFMANRELRLEDANTGRGVARIAEAGRPEMVSVSPAMRNPFMGSNTGKVPTPRPPINDWPIPPKRGEQRPPIIDFPPYPVDKVPVPRPPINDFPIPGEDFPLQGELGGNRPPQPSAALANPFNGGRLGGPNPLSRILETGRGVGPGQSQASMSAGPIDRPLFRLHAGPLANGMLADAYDYGYRWTYGYGSPTGRVLGRPALMNPMQALRRLSA